MTAAILSGHRRIPPYGMNGGNPGLSGRNAIERADGRVAELDEAFQRAIAQLPPEQRTAILLVVQQELPYEDIAEIMGVPVSSVKTWIHRARSRLRELLKDFYGNE